MPTGRIWYLVMNSSRLRILRGLPGANGPAVAELAMQSGRPFLRDFLGDRSHRKPEQASSGFDPVRADMVQFLHEIAEFLTAQRHGDGFEALVLVAPPEVLARWHAEVPGDLQSAVCCEVARNLVRLPARDLGHEILTQLEALEGRFRPASRPAADRPDSPADPGPDGR